MKGEESVEIRASPEEVWEMLALDRMPEWMGDWESATFASEARTSEDKYRPGISAHVTERYSKYDLEITESLKNERIVYRLKRIGDGKVIATLTYTLKPVEGGTRVTYEARESSWWVGAEAVAIRDGLMDARSHGALENSLNNLKTILERTRPGNEVTQFLVAGEKVILYDSIAFMRSYGHKLVLTDRRLFVYGKKGFWHPRIVMKKEINLSDIVRVYGDPGKRSRLGIMGTPCFVITSKAGEEWRSWFGLDPTSEWNYEKAKIMEMPRVSSWVNAINQELSKSAKSS